MPPRVKSSGTPRPARSTPSKPAGKGKGATAPKPASRSKPSGDEFATARTGKSHNVDLLMRRGYSESEAKAMSNRGWTAWGS